MLPLPGKCAVVKRHQRANHRHGTCVQIGLGRMTDSEWLTPCLVNHGIRGSAQISALAERMAATRSARPDPWAQDSRKLMIKLKSSAPFEGIR